MLDNNFRQQYRKEIFDFRAKFCRAGCVVSSVLILFGSLLDYCFYPDKVHDYFLIRLATVGLTMIVYFLLRLQFFKNAIRELTFLGLIFPQIMISYMIYDNSGVNSIYVFGLSLALLASSIIVPANSTEGFVIGAITIVAYITACSFHTISSWSVPAFYGNLIFLFFGVVISNFITYFNEKSRFDFFKLQKEVIEKNAQLQASNKALAEIKGFAIEQEKMSALGTLSAGLLHEVNNPVNYSLMAINMSLADPAVKAGSLLKETLVDAKDGMTRVQAIVSDLKIFAYQKPGPKDHRLFLFENVVNSARRLTSFETKGVDIQLDLPLDTHVLGDEPALIGVMINLITNATMAMNRASQAAPVIKIKGWHENARLHISTKDNGTGIDEQNISKVFEPFFTTRDVGKGLGLGLAVCYAVIQRHGSVLDVRSELGQWTEFTFDLEAPTIGETATQTQASA